ncbi:hypothetical protein [Amycolatopsis sp. cmx-4-61]|uniref:hypothetical protein n=1 Tax=Amycolatopsis sp. cmx-4-61 TaxID=2790937 RepID=UPI00397C137F
MSTRNRPTSQCLATAFAAPPQLPTAWDVLGALEMLLERSMAILDAAAVTGYTIESPEFVDCLWRFAGALLHFGRAISCCPSPTRALVSPLTSFITSGETEGVTLFQLLISLMLRVSDRVFSQTDHYAHELCGPGEESELSLLSDIALKGAHAIRWNAQILTSWNGDRQGMSPSEIATRIGVSVKDVPRWIDDAKTFVGLWPKGPPARPISPFRSTPAGDHDWPIKEQP